MAFYTRRAGVTIAAFNDPDFLLPAARERGLSVVFSPDETFIASMCDTEVDEMLASSHLGDAVVFGDGATFGVDSASSLPRETEAMYTDDIDIDLWLIGEGAGTVHRTDDDGIAFTDALGQAHEVFEGMVLISSGWSRFIGLTVEEFESVYSR